MSVLSDFYDPFFFVFVKKRLNGTWLTGQNDNKINVLGNRCTYTVCHNNDDWVGKSLNFMVENEERAVLEMEGIKYVGQVLQSCVINWDDEDVWENEEVITSRNFCFSHNVLEKY